MKSIGASYELIACPVNANTYQHHTHADRCNMGSLACACVQLTQSMLSRTRKNL
jgi:hypothetical protein